MAATLLELFRKYVTQYLNNHPGINQNLLLSSIAIDIRGSSFRSVCFTSDKEWQNYEYIMSDIFDHIIAAVPYFGLELYSYVLTVNL
jgi:miniconductance mechanosensitive channel